MLELKNIQFAVQESNDSKEIIRQIDIKVPDQCFTVITGPNGGGKSTLAKLVMGLEKPTGGQIWFDKENITDLSITERAKRKIGYAFQQPPRFKGLTIRKLLSLAHGSELSECTSCQYLSDVGLCAHDYLDREMDASLSGGEVKRIEIATLLARDLKLAIFDEPEAGIDLWSFAKLVDTFQNLRKYNMSILLISHQERIMQMADEIIVVEQGMVSKQGSREEILPQLLHEFDTICDKCL